ncbi:MAG TPA: serine hydrolase domain-containing protein [Acidimicrobiales bacterium]|nr:serine hydrolase domain-containing protein [Acidimicrobiales bacterium]
MPVPTAMGSCDPAFAAVREAFLANFADHDEVGASVAVSVEGRTVVDLWGGSADRQGRPWSRDTLVDVFSVGKAMVALSLLVLIDRGRLDFHDPVARHWPEFGAAGKGAITVDQLLSHQAGLPGLRQVLGAGAVYDWERMTRALAAESPWWDPGTAHGYHVNTLGFLGGELVRRVSGTSFARFFATEVAGPLGADAHFGLGPQDDRRVADFLFPGAAPLPPPDPGNDWSLVYNNPPGASGFGTVNSRAWRGAVHPSTNCHANARAVARVFALLAAGGGLGGVHLLGRSVMAAATTELAVGPDRILDRTSRFGFGFQLTQPERPIGPGPVSFGHFGAGGSLGMADPAAGLAFAYTMNRFGHRWQDPRNQSLLAATYACL